MSSTHSYDSLFRGLADCHRRRLCYQLAERGDVVGFDDVVSRLCEDPPVSNDLLCDPKRDRRTDRSRRKLEVELRHTHLPLAEDAGIVRYAPRTGRIEPGTNLELAEAILEVAASVP